MTGIELIAAERLAQVEREHWTTGHDDLHDAGEMACAAACYTLASLLDDPDVRRKIVKRYWPWDFEWWKPSDDPIRNLVKAGALIAAEIDRLKRLETA